MRGKLLLFSGFIIIFGGFVLAKFFVIDQQNIYGKLKILSSPTASVFINNLAIRKTPFEDRYRAGEYILKLIPEGSATDTASWNGKINVYKNALTYINIELGSSDINSAGEIFTTAKMEKSTKIGYGEIYIETEPEGAIVSLDNDEKGVAPLLIQDVIKGEHELSVFMPGFFRRTQKINIDSSYRVNTKFKLAIDQSQKPPFAKASEGQVATESAKISEKKMVIIKESPTGWLRVREEPSLSASESAKVKLGEKYEFLDEKESWYKIKFNGNKDGLISGSFEEGWIFSAYAAKE